MSRGEVERGDVGRVLHQEHRAGNLAHRALDFGMAGVADQDHLPSGGDVALALAVDLGDQRAGGIEHGQAALFRVILDAARDAVRAEDRNGAGRHLAQVLDEARAFCAQAFDDMAVVHDLVADVDRRTVDLQRSLDDVDGANDAGAEAAGLGQDHPHGGVHGRC